jgi:holliday junction DNA helicase RuvB
MTPWIDIRSYRCVLPPSVQEQILPQLHDVLFEYMARQCALGEADPAEPMTLSVTKVVELISAHESRWEDKLKSMTAFIPRLACPLPRRAADLVHEILEEAHSFCRREGLESWAVASRSTDEERRFKLLWSDFFAVRLMDWLQQRDLTGNTDSLDQADILVECAKQWMREAARAAAAQSSPDIVLPSTEQEHVLCLKRGPLELRVRGQPGTGIRQLKSATQPERWVQFAFGEARAARSALMQMVLNMALLKVPSQVEGTLILLSAQQNEHGSAFPPAVETAFRGICGNPSIVRRLKTRLAEATKTKSQRLPQPLLILGGTGCGKSELTRRVARAMDQPCVELSAAFVRRPEDLLANIRRSLTHEHDAHAPAFVLGLDHIQHWRRQAGDFLPLLDERKPRLVTEEDSLSLANATIVLMAHSLTQVPDAFLNRLQCMELDYCSVGDVSGLVNTFFDANQVELMPDVATLVAKMARQVPGRALDYARDLLERHSATGRNTPIMESEVLQLSPRLWRVDDLGLTSLDYLYLQALETGPRGLPALQQLLPVSADEIMWELEPYLIELGCVHRTSKGRTLTAQGEVLVHRHRSRQETSSV